MQNPGPQLTSTATDAREPQDTRTDLFGFPPQQTRRGGRRNESPKYPGAWAPQETLCSHWTLALPGLAAFTDRPRARYRPSLLDLPVAAELARCSRTVRDASANGSLK